MKILLVLPSLEAGGAEKVGITLLNALSLHHEVTLFVMLDRGPLFTQVNPRVRVVRGLARGNTLWRKLRILGKLIGEARRHDVVVAGLEVTATYFAYAAARLARKPLVAWVHTMLCEYFSLNYFSHRHIALCRFLYRRIEDQVFVSEGARASMLRLLEIPSPRAGMTVIHNPVEFTPGRTGNLPYLPGKPFILAVGRLAPEKGFDLLLKAFARLRQSDSEIELLILGEGEERPCLEALAQQLGVMDNVHLPGFVANAGEYYQHAAVFALSSGIEGLSTVLIEAMQSGVPIVATDLPCVYELLGKDFKPVAQGDVEGFMQKLCEALYTVEPIEYKNKRIAQAESFTPAQACQAWEKVLKRAVGALA